MPSPGSNAHANSLESRQGVAGPSGYRSHEGERVVMHAVISEFAYTPASRVRRFASGR